MDVQTRNGMCVDDLASDIGGDGEQAVARIMGAVRATVLPADTAANPMSELTTSPSEQISEVSDSTDPQQVWREIAFHHFRAVAGDAAAARRVAELHELVNNHEDAAAWWHRAAELGDPDAQAYVRHIFTPGQRDHHDSASKRAC